MTDPISPLEVMNRVKESRHSAIMESFNELISENWDGNRSRVKLDDVVTRFEQKEPNIKLNDNWLNVEDEFRKVGWKVEYSQPSWDENFDAYFIFCKSNKFLTS